MLRKINQNGTKEYEFPRTLGPRAQFRYLTVDQRAEYESDEFRMYTFKIKRCGVHRSHDWTLCPFAHKGEKARRRDPRKINYVAITCPQYRLGSCPRADLCEFAHGVFEYWLHPARYRTRICTSGANCCRKVCFFAHSAAELRPETRYRCTYSTSYPINRHPINAFHPRSIIASSGTTNVARRAGGLYYPGMFNDHISVHSGGARDNIIDNYGYERRGGGGGGRVCFVLGSDGVVNDENGGDKSCYEETPVELKLEFLESLRRLTMEDENEAERLLDENEIGVLRVGWDLPDIGWISDLLGGV